jgi:hypothetical protein
MICNGQVRWLEKGDIIGQIAFIAGLFGLTARFPMAPGEHRTNWSDAKSDVEAKYGHQTLLPSTQTTLTANSGVDVKAPASERHFDLMPSFFMRFRRVGAGNFVTDRYAG